MCLIRQTRGYLLAYGSCSIAVNSQRVASSNFFLDLSVSFPSQKECNTRVGF